MKQESKIKYSGKKGVPVVEKPSQRNTGCWRIFRPILNKKKCIKCWTCIAVCPEVAIKPDRNDYPKWDYNICKGCLICLRECPANAIEEVRESQAKKR